MTEHLPPWKWHPKSFDQDHNGSIYSMHRPGHAYAIAMQPKYVTEEEWAVTAPLIVKAVNSHGPLVKALKDTLCELSHCADQLGAREYNSVRRAMAEARRVLDAVGDVHNPK